MRVKDRAKKEKKEGKKMKKRLTTKAVLGICIAAILLVGLLIVLIGNLSQGFQDMNPENWDIRVVNEDNLYQDLDFKDADGTLQDANGIYGITVTLTEDNELKVNGTAEGDQRIVVGAITLKAGTSYIFDSSFNNGSRGSMYMALENEAGNAIAESYVNAVVIDGETVLTEDTVVYVVLHIADDTSVANVTLRPIICEGNDVDNIVSFY